MPTHSLMALAVLALLAGDLHADRAEARALVAQGQRLQGAGQGQLALKHYERAIRSDIDYLPGYELALPLWLASGEFKRAQVQLEGLTLRCQDCSFAWYALGALYRKAGRFDLAILAYEAYLAKRASDPDAHFGLAMALAATKDERTVAALQKYLSLERREERRAFREQAIARLQALGAAPEKHDFERKPGPLQGIAGLLDQGQLVSAEGLLNGLGDASAAALHIRLQISKRRGQWFQALGFGALLWIYRLAPASTNAMR